jgi:hypothetical protein
MWGLIEPIHAVTYFGQEALESASQAGYRGFWMGYFACRLAPWDRSVPMSRPRSVTASPPPESPEPFLTPGPSLDLRRPCGHGSPGPRPPSGA